jgi:hypothetical protein
VGIIHGVVLVFHKRRSTRLAVVTCDDGQRFAAIIDAPPAESFGRGQFMVLFQDSVQQAVREFRSGPTLRVLLALPAMLDWRAWRRLEQQALADDLVIDRADVTRALLKLLEAGYVQRRGKRGQYEWRLLPKLGWRGTVRQYHQQVKALNAEREPELKLGPVLLAESMERKVKNLRTMKVMPGSFVDGS